MIKEKYASYYYNVIDGSIWKRIKNRDRVNYIFTFIFRGYSNTSK